ncbi:peroxidase-related enzyme [Deinococcus yavapaiensis]|uniref:Putative peroxidase-related enzyme n=1 Tax=Deinococcus yavapaiensis KR-236 TaxID=694435 RepID=A0A318S3U9_9DEIO|nr:peroxidase-related enzyme [Deinococcus yavapaiensis]PYE53188.1 putative peroxidase-related enzyme [Deinococcus yavapaiensis KR-236]
MKRLSYLAVPTEADVTPEIAALWRKAQANLGFTPNVFRAQALNAAQFWAWWKYYDLLMNKEGWLPPLEREMVATVVSSLNRCVYCLVSHASAVRVLSGDAKLADTLAIDYRQADLTLRQRAMLDFAAALTLHPDGRSPADLEALRAVGLDDHAILELTQVVAMFNATNRISSALGFVPNEEYFQLGRDAQKVEVAEEPRE